MKKLLLTAILLAAFNAAAVAQDLQPSKVKKSENLGEYQKVSFVRQNAAYNNRSYSEAYSVNGFQLFFSPQSTVIISPDKKEIYSNYVECDGWASRPTFYFPRNKNRPFVISVETGMEEYWGSAIYIIDKDHKCTLAGYLSISPTTGSYPYDEYKPIETVLRLDDKGKKGIRFTFACDSLISIPTDGWFSDIFSSKDLYFTFINDTLTTCHKWEKLPGVQRMNLYADIDGPASSVHFFDVNNDGHEDMIYVVQLKEHTVLDDKIQKNILRSDGSSIVVCLCENGTIKEELIFDFDEPIDIDYEYPENGLIIVKKYTPGFQDQPKAATFYRLEGKELVEAIN